jgi:branched-chain amino acid transport system permease protein/neutral amino acid transport system permease protein
MISTSILLQSIGFGLVTAAVISVGAIGFTLQVGVTNFLNISYGNVMTIGAFAALLMQQHGFGLAATVLAAPVAGVVVTLILARTIMAAFARRSAGPFDMVMVTVAVGLIIQYSINAADQEQVFTFSFPTGATVHVGPFVFTVVSLGLIALAATVFGVITATLHLTRLGKAFRALSVEPRLARACGIPTRRIVNLTWVTSGALAGLAGLVYITNSLTVNAGSALDFFVLVIAAALLGGAGSPLGAVLASLVVGIATEVVAALGGSYYSQGAGLAILAIVLLARSSARMWTGPERNDITV